MRWPLASLLVIVVTGVLYGRTLDVPFVFDDVSNIVENRAVHASRLGFRELTTAAFESRLPRPVAYASFAINHAFGGLEVAGYHVLNIMIHALNGLLVYGLAGFALRRRSRLPAASVEPAALFAALLFVAHPLQTQAITYVVQRMTGLATLFTLSALLLYVRGRIADDVRRRWACWGGAGLAWLLALGSKEIAIVLPFTIALVEWTFFRNPDLPPIGARRPILFGLAAAFLLALITWIFIGDDPLDSVLRSYRLRDFTLAERLLTEPRVVVTYLTLWVLPLPSRLNLDHAFTLSRSLLDPMSTLPSLLLLAVIVGLAVVYARRDRLVSFCLLWVLLHLALESTVIGLELYFEHRMYLPSVGLALLTSLMLFSALQGTPRLVVAGLVLVLLGTGTILRNEVWRDDLLLWTDNVAKSPDNKRARITLGDVLSARGRELDAVEQYREAVRIEPLWDTGHERLGRSFDRLGRLTEAEEAFREAVRLHPDHAPAHTNLGLLLAKRGHASLARASFRQALRFDPEYPEAHLFLAMGLAGEGRTAEAIVSLAEAHRLDPTLEPAANNLAWILTTCADPSLRDPPRALRIARELVASSVEASAGQLDTLAAALAATGDFAAAVSTLEVALRVIDSAADAQRASRLKSRLDLYRAGRAYVEPR